VQIEPQISQNLIQFSDILLRRLGMNSIEKRQFFIAPFNRYIFSDCPISRQHKFLYYSVTVQSFRRIDFNRNPSRSHLKNWLRNVEVYTARRPSALKKSATNLTHIGKHIKIFTAFGIQNLLHFFVAKSPKRANYTRSK